MADGGVNCDSLPAAVRLSLGPSKNRLSMKNNASSTYVSFVDTEPGDNSSAPSLQETFLKFGEARQLEISEKRKIKRMQGLERLNSKESENLRMKFLDQAKKYLGTPYAKHYWHPDSEEYKSELFLDCCGLIRRVLRDLAEDFGFTIGKWNQAYFFDTLPITIECEEDMKPGDLVFREDISNNPNVKQQKHNITHVEIWAGNGTKTIGARWNRGKVEVFDHYKFQPINYHNPRFIFKSIDTWLNGICERHHSWILQNENFINIGKWSIFYPAQQDEAVCEHEASVKETTNEETEEDMDENLQDPRPVTSALNNLQSGEISTNRHAYSNSDEEICLHISTAVFETESKKPDYEEKLDFLKSDSGCSGEEKVVKIRQMHNHKCNSFCVSKETNEKNLNACFDFDKEWMDRNDEEKQLFSKQSNILDWTQYDFISEPTTEYCPTKTSSPCDCSKKKSSNESSGQGSKGNCKDNKGGGRAEKRGKGGKEGGGGNGGLPGGNSTCEKSLYSLGPLQPTFYIGGNNGAALVESALLAKGWRRIKDRVDENFKLKWVESKNNINYNSFREGFQLVNHICNGHLLTNKLSLLNSLHEYERVMFTIKGRKPYLKMADIMPESYNLDDKNDRETFLTRYIDGEVWICKPAGMNQGKGIFLFRSIDEIKHYLKRRDEQLQQKRVSKAIMARLVQRYLVQPLLLEDKKFDIRAYMLIASTSPYLILYHKGYVRLSCHKYDGNDTNMTTHLTNQYIQKKDPKYKQIKEETAWSMDRFNKYINEVVAKEKGLEHNWVYKTLTKQMQRIMLHCFYCVKHKLRACMGTFALYGLDFMIDSNMKVWLIEVNVNPSLDVNCLALKDVIPGVVHETLYLAIECFQKSSRGQSLVPLASLKNFLILYNASRSYVQSIKNSSSGRTIRNFPKQPSLPMIKNSTSEETLRNKYIPTLPLIIDIKQEPPFSPSVQVVHNMLTSRSAVHKHIIQTYKSSSS